MASAAILPPKARRTQSERRDASEQRLLIAAAEIIEEQGFAAATFDAIGMRAGYSRGLASQKFGSKDGLVAAVIAFLTARVDAHYQSRVASIQSPLARILAYVEVLLAELETDRLFRAYFVMMASAVANRGSMQDAFLAAHEGVRERLRELVTTGQRAGEIDAGLDGDTVALAIGSLQLGIAVELLLDPALDVASLSSTVQEAMRRILRVTGP